MNIILSSAIQQQTQPSRWIQQLDQWRQTNRLFDIIHQTVLPINRLGMPGFLFDNPPIDVVDQFLFDLSQTSFEIGLLSIPISASEFVNKKGEEISCINGWIDTTGYTGCQHIRLHALDGGLFDLHTEDMLIEIISYAVDLDITVTLHGFEDDRIHSIQNRFSQDQQTFIGKELQYNIENLSNQNKFHPGEQTNLITVHLTNKISFDQISDTLSECESPILLHV